jgi:hypothetical protein
VLALNYDALAGIESTYINPEHPTALKCRACYSPTPQVPLTGPTKCECGFIEELPTFDVTSLPALTEEHNIYALARKICMTMEYCLTADDKLLGPQMTNFPFKVALRIFMIGYPTFDPQLRWCLDIVEMLEAKCLSFHLQGFPVHSSLILDRYRQRFLH